MLYVVRQVAKRRPRSVERRAFKPALPDQLLSSFASCSLCPTAAWLDLAFRRLDPEIPPAPITGLRPLLPSTPSPGFAYGRLSGSFREGRRDSIARPFMLGDEVLNFFSLLDAIATFHQASKRPSSDVL
jgi:hypothetical protein